MIGIDTINIWSVINGEPASKVCDANFWAAPVLCTFSEMLGKVSYNITYFSWSF